MMIARQNPTIHIEISPYVEDFEEFGWEDYPVLRDSIPIPSTTPLRSAPLAMIVAALRRYGTVVANSQDYQASMSIRSAIPATKTGTGSRPASLRVHFGSVKVREHSVTVGDHDWCEGALPLCLDWKHAEEQSFNLDIFEHERILQGRTPRGRLPKLDYYQRKSRLRRVAGLSERDMARLERRRALHPVFGSIRKSKTVTKFPKDYEQYCSGDDN